MDLISDVGSAAESDQSTPIYQCSSPISSQEPSPISSVFSCDAASIQHTVTPESSSSSGEWENARILYSLSNPQNTAAADLGGPIRPNIPVGVVAKSSHDLGRTAWSDVAPSSHQVRSQQEVPLSSRQNPRRSRPQIRADPSDGSSGVPQPRPPPALVRQEVRKDSFVDSLVDTTTQTLETIWPLTRSCGNPTDKQRLIGLRTFVQEVLKRSKTSYSTLLVALHYLIVLMPCVPRYGNFTMEQIEDSEGCRAMQCGRRMFLAALILASKYLQDRNYSTRAWGKISGLKICEINTNERVFLAAINWKLHFPSSLFQRWENIVLKYSPSAQPATTPRSCPNAYRTWRSIIPQLNAELDQFDDKGDLLSDNDSGYYSSSSRGSSRGSSPHAPRSSGEPFNPTPMSSYVIPRVLEPQPRETKSESKMLPPLQPREGPLPTPNFTPRNPALCTPAVSASGLLPRKSSMAMAMAQNRKTWDESLLDRVDTFSFTSAGCDLRRFSRTSSDLSKASSSPDSAYGSQSSYPSRTSSISSVASSTCAPPRHECAWQATRRSANSQSSNLREYQLPGQNQTSEKVMAWNDPFSSVRTNDSSPASSTLSDEVTPRATLPHTPTTAAASCRTTYDAASALCELNLERSLPSLGSSQPISYLRSRKRERPRSIDHALQSSVRELITPRNSRNLPTADRESEMVPPDQKAANTWLLQSRAEHPGDLHRLAAEELRNKCQNVNHVFDCQQLSDESDSSYFPRKKACISTSNLDRVEGGVGNIPTNFGRSNVFSGKVAAHAVDSRPKQTASQDDAKVISAARSRPVPLPHSRSMSYPNEQLHHATTLRAAIDHNDRAALYKGRLWGEISRD